MDCKRFSELSDKYIDGELSEAQLFEFENHMKSCEKCAGLICSAKKIKGSLGELSRCEKDFLTPANKKIKDIKTKRKKRIIELSSLAAALLVAFALCFKFIPSITDIGGANEAAPADIPENELVFIESGCSSGYTDIPLCEKDYEELLLKLKENYSEHMVFNDSSFVTVKISGNNSEELLKLILSYAPNAVLSEDHEAHIFKQ